MFNGLTGKGTSGPVVENPLGLDYPWPKRRGLVGVSKIKKQKQCFMALLAAGLWGLGLATALGQVMDIGPDGQTAIYKGPVVASAEGIRLLTLGSMPAPSPVAGAIQASASRHALSQALIEAVAWQESHMRQEAVSPKGARGVMQLMPATAQTLQVDPDKLSANVDGGAAYLARMLDRFDGDIIKTLAAYNAGPEAVERYHGVPPYPETQAYVAAVLNRLADSAEQKGTP
jgi:soluble lytic murein transglycosylase-like protein